MQIKLLDGTLLVLAVCGVLLTLYATAQRHWLLDQRDRLEGEIGSLAIQDRSKVHVQAIETGERMQFAWRVYVPAGFHFRWQDNHGSGESGLVPRAGGVIARVWVCPSNERGKLRAYTKWGISHLDSGFGNRQLVDLLHDRWDEVQVEQLGSENAVIINDNEVATLLRLKLPDDLKREAEQVLDRHDRPRLRTGLFEISFGSEEAFQQAAKAKQAANK